MDDVERTKAAGNVGNGGEVPQDSGRPVVSNTTPLINLVGAGLLDLLWQIYGTIWIPEAVRAEYDAGRSSTDPELSSLAWIVTRTVERDPTMPASLGAGEAAAIALAVKSGARLLLLDERLGRRVAMERGLQVAGTLAVLLRAKRQGLLPAVGPVIDQMRAQGRHISDGLRARALAEAGE